MAQYRFQQEYLQRLEDQEADLRYPYNYERDPFFSTAPSYRYTRGGRYYEVNEYAAQLLQDGVNFGYEQGFLAGKADRADHWRFDYKSSYAYQDADYGYGGFYVDQDQYNDYFRQGFRRGYEDGYRRRYRYGANTGGILRINVDALRLIIDLKLLH